MHSSKSFRRRRGIVATSTAFLTLTTGVTVAGTAGADEVDDLIAELDGVSERVSAKNEDVKQLEDDVAASGRTLEELEARAATAGEKAAEASQLHALFQKEVDGLASAKYRGVAADSAVSLAAANNPQNMIDRSAYLGALGRDSAQSLAELDAAMTAAAREASAAHAAVAAADFNRSQLEEKHRLLEEERLQLQDQIGSIEARINSLEGAAAERWENKNQPEAPAAPADASGVVAAALAKLGSPYGWGATGPSAFDCSGLMVWAHQQMGKNIPRTSQAQLAGGASVSRAELQPGDIVGFYPGVTHVGMYIGNGQLVHASDYGVPVQVVSVDSMPWAGASRY